VVSYYFLNTSSGILVSLSAWCIIRFGQILTPFFWTSFVHFFAKRGCNEKRTIAVGGGEGKGEEGPKRKGIKHKRRR